MVASSIFISSILATLYNLEVSISLVYSPNIPFLVFSNTLPCTLSLKSKAFFSPGLPSELRLIPVICESNIVPSLISIILPVLVSVISWPKLNWR